MAIETEKLHDLPAAGGDPGQQGHHLVPTVLRAREADGVHPSLGAGGEMRCPAQAMRQEKRGEFLLPLLFVRFTSSTDGMVPTHTGREVHFSESSNSRLIERPETPSQTHSEIMFNLGTPQPIKLIHKSNHQNFPTLSTRNSVVIPSKFYICNLLRNGI